MCDWAELCFPEFFLKHFQLEGVTERGWWETGSGSEGAAPAQVLRGVTDLSGSPHGREAATGSETASGLGLGLFNQHKLIRD